MAARKKIIKKNKKVTKKATPKKVAKKSRPQPKPKKVVKVRRPKISKKIKKIPRVKKIAKKLPKVRKIVKIKKLKKGAKKILGRKVAPLSLKRSVQNPIIQPSAHYWESKATFNPTAFLHDGKVHIVYRAIGETDNSVLGYAESPDGINISGSSPHPAYYHFMRGAPDTSLRAISYSSGGGWGGGCEDPRVTLLDGRVYMLYTAFDGWGSVRIGLTSISLEDFISKRWNWRDPVIISPPGQIHKNWVLFPEKVNGKFAILHAISPKIMIDYVDSMDEFDGTTYIHSVHQSSPLWATRDRLTRGVGPAPIKTKDGWLVIYHKMDPHETHRYKLWAMILDKKDPTKVLYNSSQPILEPDEWYENEGYKSGVVYSCGAVVKNGKLFVYYGGADKVSCVAMADLERFLKDLKETSVTKLKGKRMKS